ncbi:hypothetical protein D3C86_1286020 [compost metagenome]
MAGGQADGGDGLIQACGAGQVGGQFGDADGLHGGQGGVEVAGQQGADLVQGAVLDHQADPRVAVGVEAVARGLDHQGVVGAGRQQGTGVGLPVTERAAGGLGHGQGADQALAVAGGDGGGGCGIDLGQAAAEGGFALKVVGSLDRVADGVRHGGNVGQTACQGVEIEAGAADQQGGAVLRRQFLQQGHDGAGPAADRPGFGGVGHAIQAVLGAGLVLERGAGAEDAQVGVELLAVGVDDDGAGLLRHVQRQTRLARGGGAGDQGEAGRFGQRNRLANRTRGR